MLRIGRSFRQRGNFFVNMKIGIVLRGGAIRLPPRILGLKRSVSGFAAKTYKLKTPPRYFNIFLRYCPVYDSEHLAIASGVPLATIVPPLSPPSGPRSMI